MPENRHVLTPCDIKFAEQAAEIAMLKSENYSDKGVAELNKAILQGQKDQFEYSLNLERRVGKLEGENESLKQRFADYKESQAEKDKLEKEVLDGKIARKYNLVTDFGKFADPLADKMLTTAAMLWFALNAITKVVVPGEAVCGKSCDRCGNGNGQ